MIAFRSLVPRLPRLVGRPDSSTISASQENKKCSHMTNMLRLLIILFLEVCAYLTLDEKSNYSW